MRPSIQASCATWSCSNLVSVTSRMATMTKSVSSFLFEDADLVFEPDGVAVLVDAFDDDAAGGFAARKQGDVAGDDGAGCLGEEVGGRTLEHLFAGPAKDVGGRGRGVGKAEMPVADAYVADHVETAFHEGAEVRQRAGPGGTQGLCRVGCGISR